MAELKRSAHKNMRVSFFAMVMVSLLASACTRERGPLHKIIEGEEAVFRTSLAPGASHEFTVKSDVPLWLSLSTDASFKAMQKYRSANPLPVRIEHQSKRQAVSTVKGAGRVAFSPIDGVIPLRLVNETDEDLQILVYSSRN
jgi:hypothetical protein